MTGDLDESSDQKITDEVSSELKIIDRWEDGLGWVYSSDDHYRVSHAIAGEKGVWIIDPVETKTETDRRKIEDKISELGEVNGIVVLSSYHTRDSDVFAERYGVPVHLPEWVGRVEERLEDSTEIKEISDGFGDFDIHRYRPMYAWSEAVAYREKDRTLIIPDSMNSMSMSTIRDEEIGLFLFLRLSPPKKLFSKFDPERIFFGHGEGVFEDASEKLENTLKKARRRFPRAFVTQIVPTVKNVYTAVRE